MITEYFLLVLDRIKQTLLRSRVFWLGVVCVALFAGLVARLYVIQIQNGAQYYENYVAKTKKEIRTDATRGSVCDRNGVVLAEDVVTYNLTIKDLGVYDKKSGEYNEMLLRLIHLLERFDVEIASTCPVIVNEHGEYEFSGTEKQIKQFIKDVYGAEAIEDQAQKGIDVYAYDTQTVMKRLLRSYQFNSNWKGYEEVSPEDALAVCNIRYAMSATSYMRYRSTTIASDIDQRLASAVLEAQGELQGVEVEEATKRVYYDSKYFSNLLGYIGKPSSDELAELKAENDSYTAADLVGKSGLEKIYESYLAGTKGTDTVYVNNVGMILETVSSVPPINGNTLYLSIDHDLTVASYNLLEQRLSSILVQKLTNESFTADSSMLADDFYIPIKDVYFQTLNNNILDMNHFSAEDASENEKKINQIFTQYRTQLIQILRNELLTDQMVVKQDATEELQNCYEYIISLLMSRDRQIFMTSRLNKEDEIYKGWANGTISIQEYLRHAVEEGWIDSSKLEQEEKYSVSSDVYESLVEKICSLLETDNEFAKMIYKTLIETDRITGSMICMALIDQGVLDESKEVYQTLAQADADTAFAFMKEKIEKIEITPAQLALDPCSGSCVVVEESTGKLLAVVSYPGYDLNRFSGTVDPEYWKQLTNDQSRPLYNRATQARTAPGSTYKMITATAALEEGVVSLEEQITCLGTYDKLDHPKCWIAREQEGGMHGAINTVGGLAYSCNFYFYEMGYRLSLNENGEYDASIGIENLNKYAQMYGFGEKSGIEIEENISTLTTEYPATSAIGQGSNNFTTISLARYAEAVATKGNLYEFTLLDKVYDVDGNLIADISPALENKLEFAESTWNALHEGMYNVTHGDGSAAALFTDSEVSIAGKSGSAQENKLRGNHGMFVSFAPYEDPEIVVAVSIPNGYTAGNAGLVSKEVYRYYFGYTTLEEVLTNSYSNSIGSTTISD